MWTGSGEGWMGQKPGQRLVGRGRGRLRGIFQGNGSVLCLSEFCFTSKSALKESLLK